MSEPTPIQTATTPALLPGPWVTAPVLVSVDGVAALPTVRLASLVPWLMQTRRVPFVVAVRALHEALAGLEGLTLYIAQKSSFARAVGASDAFGLDAQFQGRRIISRGIDMPPVPTQSRALPDGVTPGVSAALYFIRYGWGSGEQAETILEREDLDASRLVMPCDQAVALWGQETNSEQSPSEMLPTKRWTDEALALLLKESVNGARNADLARKHCVVPSYITTLLKKAREKAAKRAGLPAPETNKKPKKASPMDVTQGARVHKIR